MENQEETKVEEAVEEAKPEAVETPVEEAPVYKTGLLSQEFGSGDLNTLRDKINEIIKAI